MQVVKVGDRTRIVESTLSFVLVQPHFYSRFLSLDQAGTSNMTMRYCFLGQS